MEREQRQLNSDVYQLRKDKSRELEKNKMLNAKFQEHISKGNIKANSFFKSMFKF